MFVNRVKWTTHLSSGGHCPKEPSSISISDLYRYIWRHPQDSPPGFVELRGVPFLNYLRAIRLRRARGVPIKARGRGLSVTDLAMKWDSSDLRKTNCKYRKLPGSSPTVPCLRPTQSPYGRWEFGPGEVSLLPPGHDAWVVGNQPVVVIDISGMANYAKPA